MQNRSQILALALFALVLPACSSTQEKTAYVAPPQAEHPSGVVVDETYMANVDYIAKQRGVEVHWVNPPTRHVERVASN